MLEILARAAQAGEQQGGVVASQADGAFRVFTWREVAAVACRAADVLAGRGIGSGERVALAAGNCLEWIVADLAVQMLGGVVVPLHTSLSRQQLAWQLRHSGSRLLIGGAAELNGEMPIISPAELLAGGSEAAGRVIWQQTQAVVNPNTLASIVYTSGTSGEPKGVMLTQGNLAANALAIVQAFDGQADDCRLNSLPFSHAYGRMSDLYVSLAGNTRLALSRAREMLIADAQQVQPTLLVVVPLILARLRQAATSQFGPADTAAVRKLLGGKVRGFICGGARLDSHLHEYFTSQGTPVWEGYGLTEAAPVVSLSSASASRANSVGQFVPLTTAQIADDGELLVKGPQVMAGYWQDEAATREALQGGWLHTGDLATIDDDGYLFLHGRKREFIALASGKKVWPTEIEAIFAGDSLIEQIMLVGEGERALGALIVPRNMAGAAVNSPANHDQLLLHLASRLNHRAHHEQIRRVWVLSEPWTVEREELTPKLTLRRAVILANHADSVRRMFAAP